MVRLIARLLVVAKSFIGTMFVRVHRAATAGRGREGRRTKLSRRTCSVVVWKPSGSGQPQPHSQFGGLLEKLGAARAPATRFDRIRAFLVVFRRNCVACVVILRISKWAPMAVNVAPRGEVSCVEGRGGEAERERENTAFFLVRLMAGPRPTLPTDPPSVAQQACGPSQRQRLQPHRRWRSDTRRLRQRLREHCWQHWVRRGVLGKVCAQQSKGRVAVAAAVSVRRGRRRGLGCRQRASECVG